MCCQSTGSVLPAYDNAYFEDRLSSDYNIYAETQIKAQCDNERVLTWLHKHPQIRQDLLAAMYPDFSSDVLECFCALLEKDERLILRYPDLAVAFSVVYGTAKAKKQDFRPDYLQWWVAKNRDVPSLEESFAYYINNQAKMLYPLDTFPWPLLIYVVDNDTPVKERAWVLDKYSGKALHEFDNLYREIKHNGGAEAYTRAQSTASGCPMALDRILADGGVCSQQAYYSSRVLKSLGVPSIRLLQPGHSFMAWVCGNERFNVKYGGDHTSRKYEFFFNPHERANENGYEFSMLVSAINLSCKSYLKSKIACFVFTNLSDDSKKQAKGLLDAAIENNRYTVDAWLLYANACHRGLYTSDTGLALFDKAEELLPHCSELLCIILNEITSDRTSERGREQITVRFNRTLAHLHAANRLDLAFNVFITHLDFLINTEGLQAAVSESTKWFRLLNQDIYFQEKLFDHIAKLLNGATHKTKETWLYKEYLRSKGQLEKRHNDGHYRYYSKVALACIEHYRQTGNTRRVSAVNADISAFRGDVMNEQSLTSVLTNGTILGAAEQEVTQIAPSNEACYVWRLLYDVPNGYVVTLKANHASDGNGGAFCFTAWSDTNNDGLPDSRIATSQLKSANEKGQWSRWEFVSDGSPLFVGITMKTKVLLYYQNSGQLKGYCGLSSRMFYSRTFDAAPQHSVEPRYINLQITISK